MMPENQVDQAKRAILVNKEKLVYQVKITIVALRCGGKAISFSYELYQACSELEDQKVKLANEAILDSLVDQAFQDLEVITCHNWSFLKQFKSQTRC